MKDYLLALDQGTTSSRAILFTRGGAVVSSAQIPFPQHYPKPGWVEHDPMELLTSQLQAAAQCVEKSGVRPGDIAAVGLANQRETAVVWERKTGRPVGNAIVWQCRRTADFCTQLQQEGYGEAIREKTGLVVDAYFSGTKYQWILDHVPGARARAERGELLCGTVDSWLLWHLTGGKVHACDYSNCCRTMLFDIHRLTWDEDLCRLMKVPMDWLPQPVPNSGDLGTIAPGVPYLENLAGVVEAELNLVLRNHDQISGVIIDAGILQSLTNGDQIARIGDNAEHVAVQHNLSAFPQAFLNRLISHAFRIAAHRERPDDFSAVERT